MTEINAPNVGARFEPSILNCEPCVDCGALHSFGFDWHATAVDGPRDGFLCEGCAVRYDPGISDLLAYLREFIVDPWPAEYLMEKIAFGQRAPTLPL